MGLVLVSANRRIAWWWMRATNATRMVTLPTLERTRTLLVSGNYVYTVGSDNIMYAEVLFLPDPFDWKLSY